jgi:hypothetical protein
MFALREIGILGVWDISKGGPPFQFFSGPQGQAKQITRQNLKAETNP